MALGFSNNVETLGSRLTRNVLLIGALVIASVAYYYVVEFYDHNKNFFSQIWRGIVQESYDFYSGSPGGFYIQIGELLEKKTDRGAGIKITNRQTSGGFENATKVMNSSRAFGLLQEDTIEDSDFIRKHIRYITPFYMEQMHILYRLELLDGVPQPVLSPDNEPLRKVLANARISTGPQGSGTKIFANYILSQCKIDLKSDLSLGFLEALEGLRERKVDVVFTIAGAPLLEVKNVLEAHSDSIGLLSIAPDLFQELNKNYGLKLRPTTFKNIYSDGDRVSTIGSYAFLIASKDVPNSAILELLTILDNSKDKMKGYDRTSSFPLDQFDFRSAFKQEYDGFVMELLRNIFLFLVSISVATVAALAFLVRISSGYKQTKYFQQIVRVYKDFLPENTQLNETPVPFPRPIIWENQDEIIANLVRGISELLKLAKSIREDFESGGITISHYKHMLDNVYNIRDIFQRNLAQRLNEVLQAEGSNVTLELLRHYYTAGYLTRESYQSLISDCTKTIE